MTTWNNILSAMVVGSERAQFDLGSAEAPLGALLAGCESRGREQALLTAAALLGAYRRAGMRPTGGAFVQPVAAPDDSRSAVPASLAQDLVTMIGGEYAELLPEWLEAANGRSWRLPNDLLADALAYGRTHAEIRPGLLRLLGPRGRWLAAHNSEWKYATAADAGGSPAGFPERDAASVWDTGGPVERLAALASLRRTDPGQASALLVSTWQQETPEFRAEALARLQAGLSMADEPLLESALDDRRKEVRVAAQRLLLRLPDSRYSQRMWRRCAQALEFHATGLWKRVNVTLPTECDAAMKRDGIEPKPPSTAIGERAWWLSQIVRRTPLVLWQRELRAAPDALIAAAAGTRDWDQTLIEAWSAALNFGANTDWAVALFRYWTEDGSRRPPEDVAWAQSVPPGAYEPAVLAYLDRAPHPLAPPGPGLPLLTRYTTAWSAHFTRAVLKKIEASGSPHIAAGLLQHVSLYVPLEAEAELILLWAKITESTGYLGERMADYIARNAFRDQMRRKFAAG